MTLTPDTPGFTVQKTTVPEHNTVSTAHDPSAVPTSLISAKGDLIAGSGPSTPADLPVGADGQVLTADSTQPDGVKWGSAGAGFPGPSYGVKSENYLKWRKALANVHAGSGRAKLWCVGDSTTAGGTSLHDSYPAALVRRLRAAGEKADLTVAFMSDQIDGGTADSRITLTGWSFQSAGYWLGTGTGTIAYVPGGIDAGPSTVDTVDVYWFGNPGGGTFTVNDGGSTIGTVNTAFINGVSGAASTAGVVYKSTIALGSQLSGGTINVVWASGTCLVTAIDAYDLATPGICVGGWGVPGSTSQTWAIGGGNFPTATPYLYPGDLNILDLGINDAFSSTPAPTYSGYMQTIITGLETGGDVMLKSMIPSQGTPYTTVEPTYVAALVTLATSNTLAMVDGFARWGGTYQSTWMTTPLHPNASGTADVGSAVAHTVLAL